MACAVGFVLYSSFIVCFFCAVLPKRSLILIEVYDEYSSKLLEMDVDSLEIIQPGRAGLFPEMHQ